MRELPGSKELPEFYAGVFPTDSFNHQCLIFSGQNLVLLDTGCMEMAEAVVVGFLAQISVADKIDAIASAVDNYVMKGVRANPNAVEPRCINWGAGHVPALVDAFEEAVLAHELGHLALGHAHDGAFRLHSPRVGPQTAVVAKNRFQEFQADLWALRALTTRRSRRRAARRS